MQNPPQCDRAVIHHHITNPVNSSPLSQLKVATFNVLFDIGKEKMRTYAEHRYKKQMQLFRQLDSDILSLNEVTCNYFHNWLLRDKWITDHYYIIVDPNVAKNADENVFGNVLLSKYKPQEAWYLVWSDSCISHRPGIVVVLDVPGQLFHHRIAVVGAHFKAYDDLFEVRKVQYREVYSVLDSLSELTNELLLVGDLNPHKPFEREYIRSDCLDMWKTLHPYEECFTYDGKLNGTVRLTGGGDSWRVCYDKIIRMNSQHSTLKPVDIMYFATERVFHDEHDPEIPNKRASVLSPSDHFGLVLELEERLEIVNTNEFKDVEAITSLPPPRVFESVPPTPPPPPPLQFKPNSGQ